jgi:rhamnulokinase
VDDESLYLAVDLGAGSGRVFLVGLAPGELLLEETRRFQYPPRIEAGHLRWDFALILREILEGLREAGARARHLGRPIASLGVDSWGVDYGLVDSAGRLLEDPICYRDDRTIGVMEQVFARVPRAEIFARTGIQFLQFNTLFQLVAHASAGIPADAAHLLLIPDLVVAQLTGRAVAEYTNATTTQMVMAGEGTWDSLLLERLGLPVRLLPRIVRPGTTIGPLLPDVAAATGLGPLPVVATATHDTGSAVAGTPLESGWAYISSGTWSLVGIEREAAILTPAAAGANLTNEGGAFGTTRVLRNVMGLWVLESCRREWHSAGHDIQYESLIDRPVGDPTAVVYPDDPRLLNPRSMLAALHHQLQETRQKMPETPGGIARMILESLALRYGSVLRGIQEVAAASLAGVRIVGGGSRNGFLNQATATYAGLPVVAGPVEATVIGNACVQAVTAGRFSSLQDARTHVGGSVAASSCLPKPDAQSAGTAIRYAAVEARFSPA